MLFQQARPNEPRSCAQREVVFSGDLGKVLSLNEPLTLSAFHAIYQAQARVISALVRQQRGKFSRGTCAISSVQAAHNALAPQTSTKRSSFWEISTILTRTSQVALTVVLLHCVFPIIFRAGLRGMRADSTGSKPSSDVLRHLKSEIGLVSLFKHVPRVRTGCSWIALHRCGLSHSNGR